MSQVGTGVVVIMGWVGCTCGSGGYWMAWIVV